MMRAATEARGAWGGRLAAAYLALVGLVLGAESVWNVEIRSPWAMGDWMISYRGEFVRRGLMGEVALRLGGWLHVSPLWVVWAVQVGCYALLLRAVWRLVRGSGGGLWVMAFLYSPATLGFPLLDLLGGFRKEILFLAGLAGLILLLRNGRVKDGWLMGYVALAMGALALSHEALVFFWPYWFAALVIGPGGWRRAVRVFAPGLILGAICCGLAGVHAGNAGISDAVCVAAGGGGVCEGAIAALAQGPGLARGEVRQMIATFHPAAATMGEAVLAMLPLGLLAWERRGAGKTGRRRGYWVAVGAMLAAVLSTGWLFMFSMDWGRWIYVHVFSLFLLLLFVDQGEDEVGLAASVTPRWVGYALIAIYATTWSLPRMPRRENRSGYIGWALRGRMVSGMSSAGWIGPVQAVVGERSRRGLPGG